MSDFAHLNPRPEFEADEPVIVEPPRPAARSKKDELFSSAEAMAFERGTIARYDNVNIIRSQLEEVLPDIASYFPSSEQSIPMPELNDHEYH